LVASLLLAANCLPEILFITIWLARLNFSEVTQQIKIIPFSG